MSVLAAAVVFDEGADAAAIVDRLLAAMSARGPEGLQKEAAGAAALGFGVFRTLPEPGAVRQPARARDGSCLVVFDGRLDNRDEVSRLAAGAADCGDAELVAELCASRGEAGLSDLLGDFALAVWDERRQILWLARDVCGQRPLYLRREPTYVAAATELQAVVRLGAPTINEGFVGEALTGVTTSLVDTLYGNISRVPPGHIVSVGHGEVTMRRFSSLTAVAPAPRTDREWAEEFRARMLRAVRSRARAAGPVGVMLSGGRDSGVLLTAARVSDVPGLTAWTFDGTREATEVPFARETAGLLQVPLRIVPPSASTYDYRAATARFLDRALYPSGANSMALRRAAAAAGTRVLLSGAGGDELLATNAWHAADLLARRRWRALASAWRTLRATTDAPTTRELIQATLVPCVPRWARRVARQVHPPSRRYPWIDRRFAARVALDDRLRARPPAGALSAGAYAHWLRITGGDAVRAAEETDLLSAESGTEERTPYYDRRLIELALAAPAHLLATAPEQKLLGRLAFAGELPRSLAHPREALQFEHLLVHALDRIGGAAFFRRLVTEEAGWVNGAWVRDRVAVVWPIVGPPDWEAASALWNVAAVELWLRHVQNPKASSTP